MSVVKLYSFQIVMLKFSLFLLFFFTFMSLILFYFSKTLHTQTLIKNVSVMKQLRELSTWGAISSFFTFLIFTNSYFNYAAKINYSHVLNTTKLMPKIGFLYFNESIDTFGVIIIFLAYISGILSYMALDTRIFWKNIRYASYLNIFVIIVYFFVFSDNMLVLFIFYELLLVPSFLLVYFIAPSRRAIQASLYFVIWTQVGSFFVLCVTAYILSSVGSTNFYDVNNYNFTHFENTMLYIFLFFGFGFKVPIWPLHYWLTKTHVEAPTGFSMYLSGFLVKSALYGFYKMTNVLGHEIDNTWLTAIVIMGIIDASLKMWSQTDIKKLVAYGTVQEMNIIYLAFCWGDVSSITGGLIFCVTHCFLSLMMFYLVDCIQRRYGSRSVTEVSGILQTTPNLGITILVMCTLYSGIPGTLKFISEFYIFSGLFETAPLSCCILLFIANVIGLIGFCKLWFNVTFGMNNKNLKLIPLDLSYKEIYILYTCIFFLIFPCFHTNVFF